MCAIPKYNRNGIVGNFTVLTVTIDNSGCRGVSSWIGNEKRGFRQVRILIRTSKAGHGNDRVWKSLRDYHISHGLDDEIRYLEATAKTGLRTRLKSMLKGLSRNKNIPQRLKPRANKEFSARLKPCP
jgi:hypothetical protein